jgi:hypothetical protein
VFFQAGPLRVELTHVEHLYAPGFTQKDIYHPEKSCQRQNYLTYLLAATATKKKVAQNSSQKLIICFITEQKGK